VFRRTKTQDDSHPENPAMSKFRRPILLTMKAPKKRPGRAIIPRRRFLEEHDLTALPVRRDEDEGVGTRNQSDVPFHCFEDRGMGDHGRDDNAREYTIRECYEIETAEMCEDGRPERSGKA